ncbi:MAG TPA: hypothetical protein VGD04_10920 [Methylophilus sp.]
MRVQVLDIGEMQEGKNARGEPWFRRTFQVFVAESKIAGNIPVYATKEELESYKQGGVYDAATTCRAGANGRIELAINKLTPVKPQ